MHSQLKVMKRGDEITLVSSNGGKGFLWLLVLELAVLAALLAQLGAVVGFSTELALAGLPCIGLMVWTATHIKADVRIVMNVADREGRLTRVSPSSSSVARLRPFSTMVPADARSMAPQRCSSVDLPHPDGPMSATKSPASIANETPASAATRVSPLT